MGGRKLFLERFHLTTAQSMGASFNSSAFHCGLYDNIYIQMNCVGTPTGTFVVSASADHREQNGVILDAGNFVPQPLVAVPTCAGATIYLSTTLTLVGAPWIRVEYTRTGGTGTCDIWLSSKMI